MKALKILFFVNGPAPSAKAYAEAAAINGNVCFRNASVLVAGQPLEECDGVAGATPADYAAKFPTAVAAMESRAAKIEEMSKRVGDEPAPKKGAKTEAKTEAKADAAKPADGEKPAGWTANK